jgi:branched-chain amino acid transport system substrate-binding protein
MNSARDGGAALRFHQERCENPNSMGSRVMPIKTRLAAALAATLSFHAMQARAAEPVKIGVVMSFSGWFQPIDASTINGAMLAIKDINAKGGVLGSQIEVEKFDNKSEPPLGADGALEVINKGAKVILFPSDFDFGAPGSFVAQQNNVLAFSGASDPKFGVKGIGPLAYSISTASQAQGVMLADWAFHQKGWKKAYVLLDNTIAYTKSLCGSFTQRWKQIGGDAQLLGEDTFLNGDASIASQVSRINGMAAKPDVIMFCSYAPGGPSAIRQLRAAGLDQPIMTGESMDGDYWAGAVPHLSNFYALNFGSFYGDDSDPDVNEFFARYQKEYGQRSDASYSLRGYSEIQAWAKAAEEAKSFDADKIAAVLNTFNKEKLVVGPTTYTPELHIQVNRPMTLVQSQDGKFSFVTKISAKDFHLD